MYYLKVSKKAENCLTGEEGSLPSKPRIFVYYPGALVRNVGKVKRGSEERLCIFHPKLEVEELIPLFSPSWASLALAKTES